MSFTASVRTSLGLLPIKPLCCRRAYLYGLLYGGTVDGDEITVTLPVTVGAAYDLAAHAAALCQALLGRNPEMTPLTRGAHRYVVLRLSSKRAARALRDLSTLPEEEAAAETLADKLDFKCDGCAVHFVRGLFVAYGTVSDPAKSYHLEFKLPQDGRTEPVAILLAENGYVPGRTVRGETSGLFYKSGNDIQEVLAHLGATSLVFEFFNAQIEREIRNNENRATNCVTENIGRSMRAGARQTAAIRYLAEQELLLSLSDDLRYTAHLRLDNPEATLTELAAMHTPPITKSGLNHRLEKIMAFYEKALRKAEGEIKP